MLSLWTLIKIPGISDKMIFGVIYHPPGLRNEMKDHTTQHIYDTINYLTNKHKTAKLLLYGDFNDLNTSSIEPLFGLSQIVDFPTRETAFLEKLFTNIPEYVSLKCKSAPPVGSSDHCSVTLESASKRAVQYETISKCIGYPSR